MATYDTDFYLWSKEQSSLLKEKEYTKLDIDNLIEEIESLGRSQYDKLISHLTINFLHQLKFQYQPMMQSRSWDLSIKSSMIKTKRCLKDNPSLKSRLAEMLNVAYEDARYQASKETGLDLCTFPEERLWKIQDIFEDIEDKYKE